MGTIKRGRRNLRVIYTLASAGDKQLKDGPRYRRVRAGICRGYYLPISLRHDLRQWLGFFEAELLPFVRRYVTSGSCCYDYRCCHGILHLSLLQTCRPGRVYAIEADQSIHGILQETVSRNPSALRQAVTLRGFVADAADEPTGKMTLDEVVLRKGSAPPAVVKIDVEGSEHAVLQGSHEVIREFSPKSILEVHSEALESECRRFLEGEGYRVNIVDQGSTSPRSARWPTTDGSAPKQAKVLTKGLARRVMG